jgi:hypothetical protein
MLYKAPQPGATVSAFHIAPRYKRSRINTERVPLRIISDNNLKRNRVRAVDIISIKYPKLVKGVEEHWEYKLRTHTEI